MEETLSARLTSESPLIMQADTLADPLHPLTREYKIITSKKTKTDADHVEMGRIEFQGGLYIDETGPYLPSDYPFKALVESARMNKAGKTIERGVFILQDRFSLQYDGPRSLEALLAAKLFHYRKTVVLNKKSRTIRVRPIFRNWVMDIELVYDPTIANRAAILEALDRAGRYIGIGNRRPNLGGSFGRFSVEAK